MHVIIIFASLQCYNHNRETDFPRHHLHIKVAINNQEFVNVNLRNN